MADDPLVLRFGGSLVEQLGAQLYPSATATVAELISNAWDADAKNVWVSIPFGEDWEPESEIAVVDDGHGMTREDAQRTYLIVGRKRRVEEDTDESAGGRKLHGRKGIGKLAAFGTAGILECCTKKEGELTSFRLDYDKIRKLKPDEDYEVEEAEDVAAPTDPDGNELESGARVRLTRLLVKRKINEGRFVRSMSRRFSLAQTEMKVFINGNQLSRFDIQTQFRFPVDGVPGGRTIKVDEDWAVEELGNGEKIRWWIGFTEKPIEEDYLKGVSILARGKLAQRPFTFERSQGTTGQLGQEYLVGEVQADWLDRGTDIEDDLIQSNRDQLQLEDKRADPLIDWGQKTLEWALRERNNLRQKKAMDDFEASDDLKELLEDFTKAEQDRYLRIARTASKFPEMTGDGILDIVRGVVNASDEVQVRQMMEQIESEDPAVQERFWALVHQFGLIDARKNLSIIEGRLAAIGRLKGQVSAGAPEVPDLHRVVRDDPWLLDPRWSLLGDEVPLSDLDVDFKPESDNETGRRLDYLFVLRPKEPAPVDEVVVVEIKRGYDSSGKERRADVDEVNAFHQYVAAVEKHFEKSTDRPRVRGLVIAQGYTSQANDVRKNLEKIGDPKLEFKTWDRVIDETERLHTGWLAVSKERAESDGEDGGDGEVPAPAEEPVAEAS